MKKNKILKKIILVVVSVSVLVSALVIPSLAYTDAGVSPDNPNEPVTTYITPNVYMNVDFYENGSKKTNYNSPVFSNSNVSTDNRVVFQTPDEGDYGQLEMFSDTMSTSIYELSGAPFNVRLLKQSNYHYCIPNYNTSGRSFEYRIRSIQSDQLYYYTGNPQGLNYSVFIALDDNYSLGDVIRYRRAYDYIDLAGGYVGALDEYFDSTVVEGEDGLKGVYVYLYNSQTVLQAGYLVTGVYLSFPAPIVISDYHYNGETGFIHTISRYIVPNSIGSVVEDFLHSSDLDNYEAGYNTGYNEGFDLGYDSGYELGYDIGADESFDLGYDSGYELGYDIGADEGYDLGYDIGYDRGFAEGGNGVITSPFAFILQSVTDFMTWEFIPGVSFALIASVFVGAILMIILLKKLAGG